MILPLRVFGKFLRNAISLGATAGPSRLRAWPSRLLAQSLALFNSVFKRNERLHHLSGGLVRDSDHSDLSHRRVLHQCAFHLERTDEMTCALDHVVGAANKPIISLSISHGEIASEIPAADESICGSALPHQDNRASSKASRVVALAPRRPWAV